MSHPLIRLFDLPEGTPFTFDGEPPGCRARPPEDVGADIDAAIAAGAEWVVLGALEPTAWPHLLPALARVQDGGARAKITTHARRLADRGLLEKLRDAGLAQITVVFWGGAAETHDRLLGHPGAFEAAVETVDLATRINQLLVTVRYVVLKENHAEVGALVERVRSSADRFELVRLGALTADKALLAAHGLSRQTAIDVVQAAWEAARVTHLKLVTQGFASWPPVPNPRDAPVQPADLTLLELLRANVPVPSVTNGTWATPRTGDVSGLWGAVEASRGLHELGLQLAASGCPPLDLPPALGGAGLDRHPDETDPEAVPLRRREGVPLLLANTLGDIDSRPLPAWQGAGRGARVAVVNGWSTDNVLALSTLPMLAHHLAAAGADVRHASVWEAPLNPYDAGPRLGPTPATGVGLDPARPGWRYAQGVVEALANPPARIAHARRQSPAWLAGLDLSDRDLVIVPGFENALAVLDNATLPPEARVVVADFHLATGLGGWHQRWLSLARAMEGTWWPSERITVHALYPRYARAYWRAGVPLRQVTWRPYPLDLGQFPPGPPPASCTGLFAGGSHQRDWSTLARALQQLPPAVSARAVVHTSDPVPAPLASLGEVRLLHFYEAIANSRFVVLPLVADNRRPAGISVVSMALAAGRPVIATTTPGTIDHLRHGHDSILVPPDNPAALAAAIRRLDEDAALLEQLAAGARRSAQERSVARWAAILLDGAPPRAVWSMTDDHRGPFYAWPA